MIETSQLDALVPPLAGIDEIASLNSGLTPLGEQAHPLIRDEPSTGETSHG